LPEKMRISKSTDCRVELSVEVFHQYNSKLTN